jgi:hypothetical protein
MAALSIAGSFNNRVRRLDARSGTIAGSGGGITVLPVDADQDVLIADTFSDRIRLAGTSRLAATPSPLDCGLVPIGTTRDGEVMVTDNGSGMASSRSTRPRYPSTR